MEVVFTAIGCKTHPTKSIIPLFGLHLSVPVHILGIDIEDIWVPDKSSI